WAQTRITARSKRGSEMPGMAIRSWPEKNPPSIARRFAFELGPFKGVGLRRACAAPTGRYLPSSKSPAGATGRGTPHDDQGRRQAAQRDGDAGDGRGAEAD